MSLLVGSVQDRGGDDEAGSDDEEGSGYDGEEEDRGEG